MIDHELNAAIARWMGEGKEIVVDPYDGMPLYARVGNIPSYNTDPAAALRVLARMSESLGFDWHGTTTLTYSGGIWYCRYGVRWEYESDTPAAAICAAWRAEFGGEECDT